MSLISWKNCLNLRMRLTTRRKFITRTCWWKFELLVKRSIFSVERFFENLFWNNLLVFLKAKSEKKSICRWSRTFETIIISMRWILLSKRFQSTILKWLRWSLKSILSLVRRSIKRLNKLNLRFRPKHLKLPRNLRDSLRCLKNSRILLTSRSRY